MSATGAGWPILTFKTAVMNHTGITGNCASCHNGSTATGKPSNHFPTTLDCSTCHLSTTAFGPGTAMNHTGIVPPLRLDRALRLDMRSSGGLLLGVAIVAMT